MPIESEENLIVLVGTAHLIRILLVIILTMPDNFLVRLSEFCEKLLPIFLNNTVILSL